MLLLLSHSQVCHLIFLSLFATIFLELKECVWNHNTQCIRVPVASFLLTLFLVSQFYSTSRKGAHRPFVFFSLQWLLHICILNKCHFVFQNVYFYDVYITYTRDLQQLHKHHFIQCVDRVSNLLKTEPSCHFTLFNCTVCCFWFFFYNEPLLHKWHF